MMFFEKKHNFSRNNFSGILYKYLHLISIFLSGKSGKSRPLFFLIVLFFLISLLSCKESAGNSEFAPDFRLTFFWGSEKYKDKEITLSSQRGKPVVILFTASYCPTCKYMFEAFEPYMGDEFFIMGIGTNDKFELFKLKTESTNTKIPCAFDTDDLADKYDVFSLPLTVFITADGKILKKVRGTMGKERIEKTFNELKNSK